MGEEVVKDSDEVKEVVEVLKEMRVVKELKDTKVVEVFEETREEVEESETVKNAVEKFEDGDESKKVGGALEKVKRELKVIHPSESFGEESEDDEWEKLTTAIDQDENLKIVDALTPLDAWNDTSKKHVRVGDSEE